MVMSTLEKEHVRSLQQYWSDKITEAEDKVEYWQRERIKRRFEWGCQICTAVQSSEYGDSVVEELAGQIGKSQKYVYNHRNFALAVMEEFSHAWDPAVAGYLALCDDRGRALSWNSAKRWMRSEDESDGSEKESDNTVDIDPKMQKLENGMQTVEEASEELAEDYNEDRVPNDMVEQVEGALTRAFQILEEDEVPTVPKDDPLEWKAYREWVATHACFQCGLEGDTTIAHHLDQSQKGDKSSDALTVPLCHDCHSKVHNGNLTLKDGKWKRCAELQATFLSAVRRASG